MNVIFRVMPLDVREYYFEKEFSRQNTPKIGDEITFTSDPCRSGYLGRGFVTGVRHLNKVPVVSIKATQPIYELQDVLEKEKLKIEERDF